MTVLLMMTNPKMINVIRVTATRVVPAKVVIDIKQVALVISAVKENDAGGTGGMLVLMSQ